MASPLVSHNTAEWVSPLDLPRWGIPNGDSDLTAHLCGLGSPWFSVLSIMDQAGWIPYSVGLVLQLCLELDEQLLQYRR